MAGRWREAASWSILVQIFRKEVRIQHWSKGSCARVAFEAMFRGSDFCERAGFSDASSASSCLSITSACPSCMPRCLPCSWGNVRHNFMAPFLELALWSLNVSTSYMGFIPGYFHEGFHRLSSGLTLYLIFCIRLLRCASVISWNHVPSWPSVARLRGSKMKPSIVQIPLFPFLSRHGEESLGSPSQLQSIGVFKGAHGISAVASVSVTSPSNKQDVIITSVSPSLWTLVSDFYYRFSMATYYYRCFLI